MHLPHLSQSQAMVLALYSFGMALTQRCGLTTIVGFLSLLLGQPPGRLRQRLREWNYAGCDKRGAQRRTVEVGHSFGPLLRWLLADWQAARQLTLVLDVTYLGERFAVLAISVVYRGCAIPVAWRVLAGNRPGDWHPLWVELLGALTPVVPSGWQVYVLTDRGLYSKRLFEVLRAARWHPLMRIRQQGKWRRPRAKTWQALERLARPSMGVWCQRVVCFKADPLVCTLVVSWDARYQEPCLLVTDLAPRRVQPNAYTLRAWIEAGFKDLKRGGLHWEQTKITDPQRADRHWLVMAVALLWLIRVGGQVQALWLAHPSPALALSCLSLGWLALLTAALQHHPLPHGRFLPLDWPKSPG
jgi:hypothetical protein